MSRDRRDGYSVKPWDGRQAASGASRTALDALENAGLYSDAGTADGRVSPSTSLADDHETAKVSPTRSAEAALTGIRQTTADPTRGSPRSRTSGQREPARSTASQKKKAGESAGMGGRPKAGRSVARTIRLTPRVDAYLKSLAEIRGIDLNAAVSVAISNDYFHFKESASPER